MRKLCASVRVCVVLEKDREWFSASIHDNDILIYLYGHIDECDIDDNLFCHWIMTLFVEKRHSTVQSRPKRSFMLKDFRNVSPLILLCTDWNWNCVPSQHSYKIVSMRDERRENKKLLQHFQFTSVRRLFVLSFSQQFVDGRQQAANHSNANGN